VGLGAPHWRENARGLLTGMTLGTTAAHIARATIESIAYQVRDVFEAMAAEAGVPLLVLLADGGASRDELLMQFQADIIGCPVLRSMSPDVSALGAAYLAGLAVGVWSSDSEIAALVGAHDRFEPRLDAARREQLYDGWRAAVRRTVYEP
jgi:glycerol kinase